MAVVIPPGGTILDTFKRTFNDVPVNGDAVSTTEFLEAAESLTGIFDQLGSVAFGPVKNDILGNVKKIRDRQLAAPALSENLKELCLNELKEKKHTATEGMVWLVRGLDFTCRALSTSLAKPTQELADSFREAYSGTLKPHHSFLIKPIFSAAMGACPYRKDFFAKLGDNPDNVTAKLKVYLDALTHIVAIMTAFLTSKDAKW
ncbi:Glycolipid transfer protein [Ceratocystis lukuohia]|uniref:Glycolipid transfer protein domain-containing protein n=3 Tax=Ceratocystis TaxID=5157 RepID=A0A0F8CW55_CERFI|nr:hypothetical protein CFO_g2778 [Ceratocystis platani]PHH54163.1 hypothetical protein CFIMG_002087RA [Ceratocystis fimbriata CBS 114723]